MNLFYCQACQFLYLLIKLTGLIIPFRFGENAKKKQTLKPQPVNAEKYFYNITFDLFV